MCNETGGMVDDATVFRLGDDNFRFIGGDEYDGIWLKELGEKLGLKAFVKPSTDQLHNVAVQGPASRDIMRELIWTPPTQPSLEELKWFRFLVGRIGGYQGIPVVVSRTGYTGELGYEVFCHPDDGAAVWDAIWEAGQPHGLKPLGLEALDMIRIEAGLIFAGYEFDDQVDPFEAGIGFTVKLDSEDDFVGKDALIERSTHPQRKLVGLELEGNEIAGHGDEVYVGRQRVGVVTSGTRSPTLRKNIALCRMAVQYAEEGRRSRSASSTGSRSGSPRRWCASRSTTRRRSARGRERRPTGQRSSTSRSQLHGPGRHRRQPVRGLRARRSGPTCATTGQDPAVALRRTLGMFATGRDGHHRVEGGGGARHDRQCLHVRLARAAARADLGRPADEDVRASSRGHALRSQRPVRQPGGPVRSVRREDGSRRSPGSSS